MKSYILLSTLLLSACASHAPRRIIVTTAEPIGRIVNASSLRTPEQLKEYRFGRYVDPGDPLAMHERHRVYRVETSAGWNLAPVGGNAAGSRLAAAPPAISSNDAVVAEVNKQRAATRAFTEQTTTLNERLKELSQAVDQTEAVAKENLTLKHELGALRERLDTLDHQITDQRPAASTRSQNPAEDKW
jgi:hypothetical protein